MIFIIHNRIYEQLKSMTEFESTNVTAWFPNGRNSVRLRIKGCRSEMIFTFNGENKWSYETIDNYISRLKGR